MSSGPTSSFPTPAGPRSPRQPPARPRRFGTTRLLLGLVVLAIVGPCAYQEAPREAARWHLAAALEHREAGRQAAAWEALDRAQTWDPSNPVLLIKRARWHINDKDFAAALADVQAAEEVGPENIHLLILLAEILQHLGRHDEAIEIWKSLDRQSLAGGRPPRETALNGLAYARAIANVEVAEGLEAINQALQLAPGNAALLDTRGFLLFRQGKYEAALKEMQPAVKDFERDLRLAQALPPLNERVIYYSDVSEPPLEVARLGTAVVRYHRALVLEKLGRHAEGKLDRARARQLIGREPDETLF